MTSTGSADSNARDESQSQQRTLTQRVFFVLAQCATWLAYTIVFQGRCFGRPKYPRCGGALICSNHQSHLDPMLLGMTCPRRLNYFARKTLFRFKAFGQLISFWDAIPIDRDGSGFAGFKESIKRLRRGELLAVFPEGTRSATGEIGELKLGFITLARRGRVPIVPVGIDGARDAWPRSKPFPRPAVVHVHVGSPIGVDVIQSLTDEQLAREVEKRIRQCHAAARATRLRARN